VDEALKDIERAVYVKRYLTEVSALHNSVDHAQWLMLTFSERFTMQRFQALVQLAVHKSGFPRSSGLAALLHGVNTAPPPASCHLQLTIFAFPPPVLRHTAGAQGAAAR
jgi:hypothetical protein